MFTNNYQNYRLCMFFDWACTAYNYTAYRPILIDGSTMESFDPAYNYFGDIGTAIETARVRTLAVQNSGATSLPSSGSGAYPGVYFGTGSTPAQKTDYCLESPITSGLSVVNPSSAVRANNGNGVYTVSATYTLTNTTETEINIYEIGVFTGLVYDGSKYYSCPVLMERTVLTEPITIAPGESKVVTYKLTFNQTLNVE